jgi:hypothetical protein
MRRTLGILFISALALSFATEAAVGAAATQTGLSAVRATALVQAPFGSVGARLVEPAAIPRVFNDPAGDNEGAQAPDITTVTVDNDATGLVGIAATVPNRAALTAADTYLFFLDVDRNPATGDPRADGADYVIVVDGEQQAIGLLRWNGTTFEGVPPPPSLNGYWAGGPVVEINRSALGGTAGFNFFIGAFTTVNVPPGRRVTTS